MQHCISVDPETEWYAGKFGQLVRLRSIATFGTFKAILTAVVAATGYIAVAIVIAVIAMAVVSIGLVVRRHMIREIKAAEALHALCHQTRDDAAKLMGEPNTPDYPSRLERFDGHTVERVAAFFRAFVGDESIACALRLAEEIGGKDCYVTKARSQGMDPSRAENSQPVPADKGLAWLLMQKQFQGVHIIDSIPGLIQSGAWIETKNDRLTDVRTLMVAPVNGWEGNEKAMLGILYVTSRRKAVFLPRHTLPLKAVADLLGLVYPLLASGTP